MRNIGISPSSWRPHVARLAACNEVIQLNINENSATSNRIERSLVDTETSVRRILNRLKKGKGNVNLWRLSKILRLLTGVNQGPAPSKVHTSHRLDWFGIAWEGRTQHSAPIFKPRKQGEFQPNNRILERKTTVNSHIHDAQIGRLPLKCASFPSLVLFENGLVQGAWCTSSRT